MLQIKIFLDRCYAIENFKVNSPIHTNTIIKIYIKYSCLSHETRPYSITARCNRIKPPLISKQARCTKGRGWHEIFTVNFQWGPPAIEDKAGPTQSFFHLLPSLYSPQSRCNPASSRLVALSPYLPLRLHPSFPHRRAHASPSPPFPAFPSGSCGEASSPATTGLSRWLFTSKRVSAKPWKRYEPEFLGDACVLVVFK